MANGWNGSDLNELKYELRKKGLDYSSSKYNMGKYGLGKTILTYLNKFVFQKK